MKQDTWTRLNWLDRNELTTIIEGRLGMAVNCNETDDDLRQAIAQSIEDGDMTEADLEE